VWGVLWEIPVSELDLLDEGEGSGYRRTMLEVTTTSEPTIQAWVYVATAPDTTGSLKPYTWYLRFLVEGAVEHQLPDDYIHELRQLPGNSDLDRDRDAKKRALSCGE
jgi:hypothetical protein